MFPNTLSLWITTSKVGKVANARNDFTTSTICLIEVCTGSGQDSVKGFLLAYAGVFKNYLSQSAAHAVSAASLKVTNFHITLTARQLKS